MCLFHSIRYILLLNSKLISGPAKPTKLFQGMYFMLTHVKKTPDILKMEKEVLQGLSHDTSNEESELEGR